MVLLKKNLSTILGRHIVSLLDNIKDKKLREIAEKVNDNIPVDENDALEMLTTNSILDLGEIAHYVKTKLHGNNVYYGVNMNLNYTNICELRCPLCAFSCDRGDEGSYLLSIEEIEKRVKKAVEFGIDEVHIVGGLHPDLKLEYFQEMLFRIKI